MKYCLSFVSEKTPSVREGMKASERFNEHYATTQIACINPTHARWYSFFTMLKTRSLPIREEYNKHREIWSHKGPSTHGQWGIYAYGHSHQYSIPS